MLKCINPSVPIAILGLHSHISGEEAWRTPGEPSVVRLPVMIGTPTIDLWYKLVDMVDLPLKMVIL